ncbi:MAG TPA: O-methyltransferase [Flavisolibacter sp.]|nr:O-methyltransferase [Flavisolibacter sp.]
MELVNLLAQQYSEKYTSPEDELLKEIADFTYQHHAHSNMLSGHLQGKLLEMVSCMVRPKRILEIGTFVGYSALCLAKGLTDDGQLHTLELREEDARRAQSYFDRSFFKGKIILHVGDALKTIDELNETWDLVFIDADKENYTNYFDRIFSKVKPGGFILADNVLFHGQVLEKVIKGKNAKAIQQFNDGVMGRTDVEKLMLPVRDGVYVIRKL